jgi:hypothetical protein
MPRVGVVRLSSKVLPRAGIVCAFLSWFVSVVGLNHLPKRPGVDRAAWFVILRDPLQTGAPLLPSQEWWSRPWHRAPDSSHFIVGRVGRAHVVEP